MRPDGPEGTTRGDDGEQILISRRAWGFEVGARSLRAVALGTDPGAGLVRALEVDEVRYPSGSVAGALETLLGRHEVGDDPIAVGVTDPKALIVYSQIPSIDEKRLHDLAMYEAKLRIPLPLNEVCWDYQRLVGDDGPAGSGPRSEPGSDLLCLAAMRNESVEASIQPFEQAGVAVEILQVSPVALYNVTKFEHLAGVPEGGPVLWLDIRARSSTLTIVHGHKVWRRSLAVGGDNFTAALAGQAGLPLAKAEQLKRGLSLVADPLALVNAMRGAFVALAAEFGAACQKFSPLDHRARVFAIGAGFHVPVLVKFLEGEFACKVKRLDRFARLDTSLVASRPPFRETPSAFTACYGLALQALGLAELNLNLLPEAKRPRRSRPSASPLSWLGLNRSRRN